VAVLCVAALAATILPASVAAQTPVPGAPGTARLEGVFEMLGQVTLAKDIKGERRGQRAKRAWTFDSSCAGGQCAGVALVRHRSGGVDRLTLRRRRPGYYTGTGIFYVPLRCAGRTVRRGESVPFTITLTITGAQMVGTDDVANAVSATYMNRSRRNLTRCVAFPGHDAASYTGKLLALPPPPNGALSGQSPAGS
jgi:hypothetical protein